MLVISAGNSVINRIEFFRMRIPLINAITLIPQIQIINLAVIFGAYVTLRSLNHAKDL